MHDQPPSALIAPIDRVLRLLRALGLIGLLGGLASLTALWAFGPAPLTVREWQTLQTAMRAIFYPCFFAGVLVLVPVGLTLWWRRRSALRGQRWFRVMATILIVCIPVLHISARLTSHSWQEAIDAGELSLSAALWNRLGWLFLSGLIVLLVAAWIAIAKPRMGQRV
jgi:hypothetical protein